MAMFQRAIEAEPNFADNHRQLGMCHAELGDIGAARQAIRRAVELDGRAQYRQVAAVELYNFGGHVMGLAADHRDAGRPEAERTCYLHARGLFALALDTDPSNAHATKALRIVEKCLGDRA
jgi:tetratricopeptide (TPR) repeat protein